MRRTVIALTVLLLAASLVMGQGRRFDPAARAKEIAPFIDDQAVVVGHVDLTRLNLKAAFPIIARMAKLTDDNDDRDLDSARALLEKFAADMVAAGATHAYAVISIADIPSDPLIVVPLRPDANARAIRGLLYSGRADGPTSRPRYISRRRRPRLPMQIQVINNAVIRCEHRVLQRVKAMKPHARAELAKAFAAAGDTAAQLLVVPTADSRRVIEAMMPHLPASLGGGPITAITRGVMWLAISADGPPKMSLRLHIQSQDAASAKALGALIPKAVDLTLSEAGKESELRGMVPALKEVFPMLLPQVQGSRLALQLDSKQVETVLFDLLVPPLRRARMLARLNLSASRLKFVAGAVALYRSANRRAFPPDLDALVSKGELNARSLISPLSRKKAYVYIRPPAGRKIDGGTVIVYEDPATHKLDKTVVLFANRHVEIMKVDKHFRDIIKKARDASLKAYGPTK